MFDIELIKRSLESFGYEVDEGEDFLIVTGNTETSAGTLVSIRKDRIEGIKVYLGQIEIYLSAMNSICFSDDGIVHGAIFKP